MKLFSAFILLTYNLFAGQNTLRGTIQGADGLPVSGAAVYLQGEACPMAVTVSGLDGTYEFQGLADGDYRMKAWQAGNCSSVALLCLNGGKLETRDAELSVLEGPVDVTLKISPLRSREAAGISMHFELSADAARNGALQDLQITEALKALQQGEYEIVLARPGSAYVGTCLVLLGQGPDAAEKTLVHTSGVEIESSDYVQAISDQAALAVPESKRL